jgi:hypothetical protein
MNTTPTPLQTQLAELENLSAFAVQCGISRRTLINIRDGNHKPNSATLLGLDAALKKFKPAKKSQSNKPE